MKLTFIIYLINHFIKLGNILEDFFDKNHNIIICKFNMSFFYIISQFNFNYLIYIYIYIYISQFNFNYLIYIYIYIYYDIEIICKKMII